MAIDFRQRDTGAAVIGGGDTYCSSTALAVIAGPYFDAVQGGSAGSGTHTYTHDNPGGTTIVGGWEIAAGAYVCSAGTWNVRVKTVSTSDWLTITDVDICHIRGGVSIATIGHVAAIQSLEFTGTFTFNVTGSAVTLQAGDYIAILITMQNDDDTNPQSVDFKSDQNITAPLAASGPSPAMVRRLRERGSRWL